MLRNMLNLEAEIEKGFGQAEDNKEIENKIIVEDIQDIMFMDADFDDEKEKRRKILKASFDTEAQERAIHNNIKSLDHSFEAFINNVASELVNQIDYKSYDERQVIKFKKQFLGQIKYYLHCINFKTEEGKYFYYVSEMVAEWDELSESLINNKKEYYNVYK